jgi:uncharacterized protein
LKVRTDAFFLPVDGGRCFCIYRRPANAPVVGTILHAPAFGEEMNKCRPMVARASRVFAASGFGVLQIDLLGCGDSSGSHEEASLARWTDNLTTALEWLDSESSARLAWIWAVRGGALFVPSILRATQWTDASVMLWQPVMKGQMQLTQWLRQKAATSLIGGRPDRGLATLRERLRAGEVLEIGGYDIGPRLAAELEEAQFDPRTIGNRRVAWLEVDASAVPMQSPFARKAVDQLLADGVDVEATAVQGPAFWQSVEIERCDALIDASLFALTGPSANAIRRDPLTL